MPYIPWSSLQSGTLAGYPKFIDNALQTAKGFLCERYAGYRDWSAGTPFGHGLGGPIYSLWDRICDRDEPPSPSLPDQWYQTGCPCQGVRVRGVRTNNDGSKDSIATIELTGPVYSVTTSEVSGGAKQTVVSHATCSNGQVTGSTTTTILSGGYESFTVQNIGPDNVVPCASPLPFPDNQPPTPPPTTGPEYYPVPVGGPGSPTLNLPVVLIRPTAQVDLNLDINVQVGPVNFNFDLGGVYFEVNPNFNFYPPTNRPELPPSDDGQPRPPYPYPPDGPEPPTYESECDLTPVLDELDSIQEKVDVIAECNPCPPSTVVVEQLLGSGDSGEFVLSGLDVVACSVELTQIPINAKRENGVSAPDVLYAGWGWFIYGGGRLGLRQPIDAQRKIFTPQNPGPSGFAYTLRAGYIGSAAVLKREED